MIGTVGAVWATGFLEDLLFRTTARDPMTFLGVSAFFAASPFSTGPNESLVRQSLHRVDPRSSTGRKEASHDPRRAQEQGHPDHDYRIGRLDPI